MIEVNARVIEIEQKKQIPELDWELNDEAFRKESFRVKKDIAKRTLIRCKKARDNKFIFLMECYRDEYDTEITINKYANRSSFHFPLTDINRVSSPETYLRARRKLIQEAWKDQDLKLFNKLP